MGITNHGDQSIRDQLDALHQEIRRMQQEQQQIQDHAQHCREQLEFVEALIGAIGRGEPAHKMLTLLTDRICRLFHCSSTSVSLLSEDGKTLHMEHYATTAAFQKAVEKIVGKSIPPPLPLDIFLQYKAALESCHPTAIHDLASINSIIAKLVQFVDLPTSIRKQFEKKPDHIRRFLGINAILWLPLCAQEQAIGLLELTRDIPFSVTECQQLQTMVTAAGALIHLKQREQQFIIQSIALESAACAIVITDREGNIVWVNPAFTQLTGYPAAEALGRNPHILKSGQHDRPFYQTLWETILAGQVWRGEIINKRKDGTLYTEESIIAPVKNQSGVITNFIAIKQDVTHRKQLEAALQQREQNFHDVVAHAPYGILVIDETGRFLFANRKVTALIGYTIAELLQLNSEIMIPPEDLQRIRTLRHKQFRGEPVPGHYEQKILRQDGTVVLVEFTITMTDWNGQPAALVIVQDLSERQKMIADLQQRQAELSLLNRVITAATKAGDPESILTIGCQELAHYFNVPQAAAALFNDDQTQETVVAEYCAAGRPCATGTVLPVVGNPATQYVIDHRQPLAVVDVQSDPRMAPVHEILRRRGTVSMLLLPLTTRDKVIGTIGLDSLQKRTFSSAEIRLAANVAGAVAQAVARTQLLKKEQQWRAELEELRKISLQITANLQTEELLKVILASAMQLTTADDAHIFLYDGQRLHFGAAMNRKGYMSAPISEPRRDGITYTVARTGRRFVVPDVDVHPLFENYRWGGAIADIPLAMGGRVIGVMNIAYNHAPHHFSEDELRILALLADQAAVAIANAQAYEEANRRAAIQKALRDVIVAAVDAADLQSMLDITLHTVLDALGLTMGAIWTGEESAYSNMPPDIIPAMAETIIIGRLQLQEPHVIADWENSSDPKLQQLKEKVRQYRIRASITVPIESGSKHLGGLSIADTKPHHWGDDEVELIESAGREIGIVALQWQLLQKIQREAEQRQQIMESVDEGIVLLDEEGRVITTNELGHTYLQLFHLPGSGAGQPATTHLTALGDHTLYELLSPPVHGGRHEIQVNRRTFRVAASRLKGDSLPRKWVLTIQEATQEKEMQEQLRRQERLAVVGQLAAGIAHDFNNIMSINILFAQLGMRTPGIPDKLQQRLQTIYNQSKRATTLIEQILDFSRSAVLERTSLNLVTFLKEITKLLDRTLPENIHVKMRYGEDEYVVSADPTRMQQVIMNLAINARDSMPQGGQLTFDLSRADSLPPVLKPLRAKDNVKAWVRLTVSDNGTGIPEEVLPHIFEPFFTTKPPGQGTGLGLAQVYGIVKQHGGEIDVVSQVGRGSTFAVYLPAPAQLQTTPVASADNNDNMTEGRGEVILVVEDDPGTREALSDSLEELNYQSLVARDGEEALAILAEQHDRIALILSDVIMPEMGGVDLFRAVRQRYSNIKFILLSGHPRDQTLTEAEQKTLTAWLSKPVDLSQLAETLARV